MRHMTIEKVFEWSIDYRTMSTRSEKNNFYTVIWSLIINKNARYSLVYLLNQYEKLVLKNARSWEKKQDCSYTMAPECSECPLTNLE